MTSKQLTQNQTSQAIAISAVDLIQQFKLSRQMPLVIAGVVKQKIIEQTAIQQNITLWGNAEFGQNSTLRLKAAF